MWLAQVLGCMLIVCRITRTSTISSLQEHPKPYQFGYTVRDEVAEDFKTHQEVNDGKEVRGMHSVGKPNGDLRVMTYTANRANGFKALVKVHPGASPVRPNHSYETTEQRSPPHSISPSKQRKEDGNYNIDLHVNVTQATTIKPNLGNQSHIKQKSAYEKQNETKSELLDSTKIELKSNASEKIIQVTDVKEGDKIMTLFKDLPHFTETKYTDEDDEDIHDSKLIYLKDKENLSNGPQIIPVKIQYNSDKNWELLQSELNEELSTLASTLYYDDEIIKNNTTDHNQATQRQKSSTASQIQMSDHYSIHPQIKISHDPKEKITSADSQTHISSNYLRDVINSEYSQIKNATSHENESTLVINAVVKQNHTSAYKRTNTKDAISSNLESFTKIPDLFNTTDTQMSQEQFEQRVKQESFHIKIDKPVERDSTDNTKKGSELLKINNDNVGVKTSEVRPNNKVMLVALMAPTDPELKFTCIPDKTHKDGAKMAPTMPSNESSAPMQGHLSQNAQEPVRMIFTTSIPLYPFQTVNFHPIKNNDFISEANAKFTSQSPFVSFSTKPQLASVSSTASHGLTILQEISYSGPTSKENVEIPKPPEGYSRIRSGGASANTDQIVLQSGHYPHLLLPPSWSHHPRRPLHSSHYRHMPIFVLPMSHNLNFAPTFNPGMFDKHNH